jgi:teichoic acid transport system ATP-binding protein
MNKDIAIKVENLSKVYKLYNAPIDRMKEALHPRKKSYHKEFYALSNVSFEVKKGETVGIIGKNGSGKSTLLKMITGVLTPSSGSVEVKGRISALLELGAGFNMEYTGLENIYFQGNLMGFEREEMEQKVQEILEFADIGDFIYQPVKNYSSGMFARLAFAVAINVEPDILIVDEALAVGDANFQLKCHKRMDELRDSGVTILFVSHDTYSVKALCQKALFLNKGFQQGYGAALEMVNDYLIFLDGENQPLEVSDNKLSILKEIDKNTEPLNQDNVESDEVKTALPAKITLVDALGKMKINNNEITVITGETVEFYIEYEIYNQDIEEVVLVFNLYRERDKTYVCGTTTLMDGFEPIKVKPGKNSFKIRFDNFSPLSGKYRLRIAVNEKKGLGIIAEQNDAIMLIVKDKNQAEGVVNLDRKWIL